MSPIRKRILTDEQNQPVAVQIDYADWLEIERALEGRRQTPTSRPDPNAVAGMWRKSIDGVEYQRSVRGEWPE